MLSLPAQHQRDNKNPPFQNGGGFFANYSANYRHHFLIFRNSFLVKDDIFVIRKTPRTKTKPSTAGLVWKRGETE